MIPLCDCDSCKLGPGFCTRAGLHLTGRLWELSRMENEQGDKYRNLWFNKKTAPTGNKSTGCRGCGQGARVSQEEINRLRALAGQNQLVQGERVTQVEIQRLRQLERMKKQEEIRNALRGNTNN